jgi:hypothetical protein
VRRQILVLAVVTALALSVAPSAGARHLSGVLPAPFDTWSVELTPDPDDPRIVELAFDSAVLGRRAISHVYLPDAYGRSRAPMPVAYFLHGTIRIETAEPVEAAADLLAEQGQPLPYPLGAGNGRAPTAFVRHSLDRAEYLIVTPDTGPEPWCEACFWIDGYRGAGVAAETHLHDELIPLVEAVFDTRTDRGGRAVFGRSMGAGGALIQGFRHPDRFAFIGALSPYVDVVEDPVLGPSLWAAYTRGQGYPSPTQDEIAFRGFNPADLASAIVGIDTEVVVILGDGCVANGSRACAEDGFLDGFPAAAGQEIPLRANGDREVPQLIEQGVPITYIQREGTHGTINQDGYERWLLPRLNATFAREVAEPARFSYKAVDPAFSVWGWDVAVDRPNVEFLSLLGARTDGREVLLAGTGTATVTTPATFASGRTYEVVVEPIGGDPATQQVTADDDGRLTVTTPLGPTRDIDERRVLLEQGQFQLPQVRLSVLDEVR